MKTDILKTAVLLPLLLLSVSGSAAEPPQPQHPKPGGAAHSARRPDGRVARSGPLFRALDKDHDGVLSPAELDGAAAALRNLDRNQDGKIELREMGESGPLGSKEVRPSSTGCPHCWKGMGGQVPGGRAFHGPRPWWGHSMGPHSWGRGFSRPDHGFMPRGFGGPRPGDGPRPEGRGFEGPRPGDGPRPEGRGFGGPRPGEGPRPEGGRRAGGAPNPEKP